ncbi:hypothetical protein ACTQ6A_13660 [Lachnospiraceae bacterium LCP25S3_G4]
MKVKLRDFYKREWTMSEKILLTLVLVLSGIVTGIIFAPRKGGCFSNNIIESRDESKEE